jgi:MFS family permease
MQKESFLVFLGLFIPSVFNGLLADLTPFIYAVMPITRGYLAPKNKPAAVRRKNIFFYVAALILIFTSLGVLITFLIGITGIDKLTDHWIFNFMLFRFFLGLGISLLGAFELKLPAAWYSTMVSKSGTSSLRSIFYMALTLPVVAFAYIVPMVAIVLMMVGSGGKAGPIVGLFGFSVGLVLPVIFPIILKPFATSKALLNEVKVLLGFFAFLISLKFFSSADVSLGWHILDRDMIIIIWMLLSFLVALYMLGLIRLPRDYSSNENRYGESYVTLPRLFIAILLLTFMVYLLPGIWGAPLHALHRFLPD